MRANRIDPSNVDLDYLKDEFNRFRAEIGGMKEKLGTNAADALDQMSGYLNGTGLSSRLSALEAELAELGGRLKGQGKVAVNKLEHEVGQRPLASIAVAFGAGLLISQFIRRR